MIIEGSAFPYGVPFGKAVLHLNAVPQMPFPGKSAPVSVFRQYIGIGGLSFQVSNGLSLAHIASVGIFPPLGRKFFPVHIPAAQPVMDAVGGRNGPCKQGCPGGRAHRRGAEEIVKPHSRCRDSVQIGCMQLRRPRAVHGPGSLIIC